MNNIDVKGLVQEELNSLLGNLKEEANSPEKKEAIARMTRNMTMLPIWMAQGEDVTEIVNDMKAESMLRGVSFTLKSQTLSQQAWFNVITKIVTTAIGAAL